MLESNGLQFEGQEHSGLDDTKNLARVAQLMVSKGFEFTTDHVSEYQTEKLKQFWKAYIRKLRMRQDEGGEVGPDGGEDYNGGGNGFGENSE